MNRNSLIDDPSLRKPELGLHGAEFWAITRHEAIAGAAEEFLSDKARDKVTKLIKPIGGPTRLRSLAGWADRIKRRGPKPGDDDETVAFLNDPKNKAQDTWHYVNIPALAENYDREKYPDFTRDDDVVQMTLQAINVLQGRSDRFSELNALRLITHYVGDLHQPIHVGCGYLKKSEESGKLTIDPAVATGKGWQTDRGGGQLILPEDANNRSLHEYWDGMGTIADDGGESAIFGSTASRPSADAEVKDLLVQKLAEMVRVSQPKTFDAASADVVQRVYGWAEKSLAAARQAYQSLQVIGRNGASKYDVSWEGKATYDDRCRPIANRQVTAAARNLAGLLNEIWR